MKYVLMLFMCTCSVWAIAQEKSTPAFGKIDNSDLELASCDFEKDANAMVLFDKGSTFYDQNFDVVFNRHKRIKLFNDKAKNEADIRIEYRSYNHYETVSDVQAQTINLVDGKPIITKLDRKSIFFQPVDKYTTAVIFTFPNIKPGSVIEYKYRVQSQSYGNVPDWFFQEDIPVRYSEYNTSIPEYFEFRKQYHVYQSPAKNTTKTSSKFNGTGTNGTSYIIEDKTMALSNVVSLHDEPYMSSRNDNLQSVIYQLVAIKPVNAMMVTGSDTWEKIGGMLADDEDFGLQIRKKLKGEEAIISKARSLKTYDEKIAYVFNEVKQGMKWNGLDRWYTIDGTPKAWDKKVGNSTEINLMIVHLLKEAGVKVYPMVVSTRSHGRVNMAYANIRQFNRTVAYVPVDSTKSYVLDATNKYQPYNQIPYNLLNSMGFYIDKQQKKFDWATMTIPSVSRHGVFLNAEISPKGTVSGKAILSSFGYYKNDFIEKYKSDGEEKYRNFLTDKNNSLKIKSLKLNNAEVDSLPLNQELDFDMELTGSDNDYIYVNPNVFSTLKSNIFLNQNRMTDIDLGFLNNYNLLSNYKIPAGFKADALPKNINIVMPDKSISFKRLVVEAEGIITVRYVISYNKAIFYKEDYGAFHEFYKQMQDMLNEQIVLKKS